jgi:hypothetical protein
MCTVLYILNSTILRSTDPDPANGFFSFGSGYSTANDNGGGGLHRAIGRGTWAWDRGIRMYRYWSESIHHILTDSTYSVENVTISLELYTVAPQGFGTKVQGIDK